MRAAALLLSWLLAASAADAQTIVSEYTEIGDESCSTFDAAAPGEGEWALIACAGWRGYPVLIAYDDARESVFYGFPPADDAPPFFRDGFRSFNRAGSTVEWRIRRETPTSLPLATIHRWHVSDLEEPDREIEVLVVKSVSRIGNRQSCVIGYVVATGNAEANEKARRIADEAGPDFACDEDPVIEAGDVPLPPLAGGR